MLIMNLPFIIGWVLIYFAQNLAMIYIGRFLTGNKQIQTFGTVDFPNGVTSIIGSYLKSGLAGGSFTIIAPVFIAETADIKYRGGLASAFDLMVSTGMFFM